MGQAQLWGEGGSEGDQLRLFKSEMVDVTSVESAILELMITD